MKKSVLTITIVIILGLSLNFISFFSPLILKTGGDFNTATGNYDIPIGYPIRYMNPDMSVEYPDSVEYINGDPIPPPGWRRPLKFNILPFIINLTFWIFISAIIVLLIKMGLSLLNKK